MSLIPDQVYRVQKEAPISQPNTLKGRLKKLGSMLKELDTAVFVLEIERTDTDRSYIYVSVGNEVGYDIEEQWMRGRTVEEVYEKYYPKIKQLVDKHILKNI